MKLQLGKIITSLSIIGLVACVELEEQVSTNNQIEADQRISRDIIDDYFGSDFSIAEQGPYGQFAIVGAWASGDAHFYKRDIVTGQWLWLESVAGSAGFGHAVHIYEDAALVSTGFTGTAVNIYRYNNVVEQWQLHQTLLPAGINSTDRFGYNLAMDDEHIYISAHGANSNTGAVYVYDYDEMLDTWNYSQTITAADGAVGDNFGFSLAASGTGQIMIGATGVDSDRGAAYMFDLDTLSGNAEFAFKWQPAATQAGDGFGWNVAVDIEYIFAGAPRTDVNTVLNSGVSYVADFERDEEIRIEPPININNQQFGWSISTYFEDVLIGAINNDEIVSGGGAAFRYVLNNNAWQLEQAYLPPSNEAEVDDAFGAKVQLTNDQAVIGIDTEDGLNEGVVYFFNL